MTETACVMGCSKTTGAAVYPPLPADTSIALPAKTYLALGDSYTIGQSVATSERFPQQTVALLQPQGIKLNDPDYIATTGWTTGNLLNAIETTNPPATYNVVSLLIGVNNQYQGRDTAEYRLQFSQCLAHAIRLAAGKKERVFVLSIPDYSITPFARNYDTARISQQIDLFNAINRAITMDNGVTYIDITPGSRDGRYDAALIASDGLHPSGKEYAKWAAKLSMEMMKVLK